MSQTLAIAGGGALGALLRYWMSGWVYALLGRGFPWGTLAVNLLGSLVMGWCFVWFVERAAAAAEWRAFWMVGLLGAFTTFSTFSMETLTLMTGGEAGKAVANALASVGLCIAGAWAGVLLGRLWP
jgi:CrcB protein